MGFTNVKVELIQLHNIIIRRTRLDRAIKIYLDTVTWYATCHPLIIKLTWPAELSVEFSVLVVINLD